MMCALNQLEAALHPVCGILPSYYACILSHPPYAPRREHILSPSANIAKQHNQLLVFSSR